MVRAGIVAGPLYVVVSLIEVVSRDGFDPRRHAWSQLANGAGGWVHSATLIVSGLLIVLAAYRWGRGTSQVRKVVYLTRAEALGEGPYTLRAMIAACHARATRAEHTDWSRISALYEVLAHVRPGPVVRLNQAVALGFAGDPARGLRLVDDLDLPDYPHLPGVRAELLDQLGRGDEAVAELERAATMTRNVAEQRLFRRRAARIRSGS